MKIPDLRQIQFSLELFRTWDLFNDKFSSINSHYSENPQIQHETLLSNCFTFVM